jgi:hypothetical protein
MRRSLGLLGSLLLAVAMLLPSAAPVAADSLCGTNRAFSSAVTFPAGFWSEGTHTITFDWSPFGTTTGTFLVADDAPLYPGQVFISAAWPGIFLFEGPGIGIDEVNPGQVTVAIDALVSTDKAEIDGWFHNTTETVSWDGGPAVTTHFDGPRSLCVVGGPNKQTQGAWYRHYAPPVK